MDLEELVGEAREREILPMPPRERAVAGAIAAAFVLAAGVIAVLVPMNRPVDPLELALLVGLAAVARHLRFEIGSSDPCADQLPVIPMLIPAPLPLGPIP